MSRWHRPGQDGATPGLLYRKSIDSFAARHRHSCPRPVWRHFSTRDDLRRASTKLVNATFAARDPNR
ncbi:hypothetical protein [Nocardia noduli]|uniref:hypothetical protein n=1 Tax=Nocardia noduli TaxID=2815722 RepID=UPI001C24A822|nr:hypothetical protein [Nocardia noduli]